MRMLDKMFAPGGILTYKGRIGRRYFTIWHLFFSMCMKISGEQFNFTPETLWAAAIYFLALILLLFNLSKRLHDMDYPGWLAFAFTALVCAIYIIMAQFNNKELTLVRDLSLFELFFMIKEGTQGVNQYGDMPENKGDITKT